MRLLEPLNLADLRALSLRPDLDADERATILLEWRRRELRAGGIISLLLERWVLAQREPSYERFLGMHRQFRPWSGDDEAAQSSWRWWTGEAAAARAAAARKGGGAAGPRPWKIDGADDRRAGRTAGGLRDESAMHRLGYVVGGAHGLPTAARRALLDRFFTEELPPLVRANYGDEYAGPWSEQRLRRMSSLVAWNIDRFRRHDPARFGASVEAWASDLEYLRARWHDGWFAFPWPRVAVMTTAHAPAAADAAASAADRAEVARLVASVMGGELVEDEAGALAAR